MAAVLLGDSHVRDTTIIVGDGLLHPVLTVPPTVKPKGRLHEFDSLRGLAASGVVGHHFCNMYYPAIMGSVLYPLVAGREAVMLFFLLSGFVLSLPYLRGTHQPYAKFAVSRMARIYLPYACALAIAVVCSAFWYNSRYVGTWNAPPDIRSIMQHVLLLGNYPIERYNTAFWSLRMEIGISLIFPFLAWLMNRIPFAWSAAIIVACTLARLPGKSFVLEYIGIFLFGILLAKHLNTLQKLYLRMPKLFRVASFLGGLAIYTQAHWLLNSSPVKYLRDMPVVVGAAIIMIVALSSPTAKRILNLPVLTWVGSISYSLYLVHATVLFSLAGIMRNIPKTPAVMVALFGIYIAATLLFAWLFYLAVEKPCIGLSHAVKKYPFWQLRIRRSTSEVDLPVSA